MSNPARDARQAAAANGFTETKAKHRHGITLRNPTTGKCCFETQVGQIYHYGPTLEEADSAWVADADPNYLKMVKADFNLRARKSFQAGDLLRWTDPITGQYVTLQPNNLSWVDNVSGSQQFIASPAAIASPSVADDVLLWSNGYGTGRHFKYLASTTRLTKHLIIDSLASLPAATVSNPYLELAFVMTPSSGVSPWVGGAAWGKKTTKSTVNSIAFKTSGDVTLWSFSVPTAHDSADGEVAGIMQLRKQGGNLIVSVRFPKAWIDAAQFPIYLDPTLDYQVGAGANDGFVWGEAGIYPSETYAAIGKYLYFYSAWALFTNATIPAGATIDSAYVSLCAESSSSSGASMRIFANDAETPSVPADASAYAGKVCTTAYADWSPGAWTKDNWYNSPSLVDIISELAASYDYSAGRSLQILIKGTSSGNDERYIYMYEKSGNVSGPKLYIEYTEAAGGDPEGSLVGGKLIRGGLLLHGVLGR